MKPIISIVTPSYNRADILETAIKSVYAQGIDRLEFIIIDGGSTDYTREVVKRYPEIIYYSEPDNGIYDAVNKGIRLAKGQYIGWLNSDDYYPKDALRVALHLLQEHPNWAAVFGDAEVCQLNDPRKPVLIPAFRQKNILQKVASDSFSINAGVIKREVFDRLNYFDLEYKIASDRDFMFRFGLADFPFGTIKRTLYVYQMSSTSLTFSKNLNGKVSGDLEEMQIASKFLRTDIDTEVIPICIAWHSRSSADAAMLNQLNGKWRTASTIKSEGLRIDRNNWKKFYLRAYLMFFVRKIDKATFFL